MARIAMACIALLGLVGVLACSTGKDKADDTAGTGEIAEVVASETIDEEGIADTSTVLDGAADTVARTDTTSFSGDMEDGQDWSDEYAWPCEGEPGCPCESTEDCKYGLCVFWWESKVCSPAPGCMGDCPPGWDCRAYGSGADMIFDCVLEALTLCMPCTTHAQCGVARCMDYGAAGSFCANYCWQDSDCREGYDCETWLDIDGEEYQGCRKQEGECDCWYYAAEMGTATTCVLENEYGTCLGERHCAALHELTDCQGEPPAPEECDGIDNDCDGLVDEDFGDADEDGVVDCCEPSNGCGSYVAGVTGSACQVSNSDGICTGTFLCVVDQWLCDAPTPESEVCDGVDNDCDGKIDEAYPDPDQDCLPACVDVDGDGDMVPDWADNCAMFPNPGQEDNDGDTIGDGCDSDDDNDSVEDESDNCPLVPNPEQVDEDGNGLGDACQDLIGVDSDGDGVLDVDDCAPLVASVYPGADEKCDWVDNDCDGLNNEDFPNPYGLNNYAILNCEDFDDDQDCVAESKDNCPGLTNKSQSDMDGDGLGDACDDDIDGDGFLNEDDCGPELALSHPEAAEICDNRDNDCDGEIDEGVETTDCQDCDPCTIDICMPDLGGCVHEPVECPEGQTCNEWGQCE